MDLVRVLDLASLASRLHPEFRTGTVLSSVGSYLISEEGKPARNQLLTSGAQWVMGGIAGALGRLSQSTTGSNHKAELAPGELNTESQAETAHTIAAELARP